MEPGGRLGSGLTLGVGCLHDVEDLIALHFADRNILDIAIDICEREARMPVTAHGDVESQMLLLIHELRHIW